MNSTKAVGYAMILAALFELALIGCGKSDQQAAAETARAFMDASRRGDDAAIAATLTLKAREQIKTHSSEHSGGSRADEYTVGSVTVEGENAEVPVRVKENGSETPITFKERREEGQWRIYAIRLDEQNITVDLEHPEAVLGDMLRFMPAMMGGMFRGLGEGMGEMFKGMGEGFKAMGEGFKQGFGTPAGTR